ncbi:BppU family phage baseplate upper protein [Limosilactobacillus coleohominis]|uniref:BppU family phage baseplate upper protein n=1 Tax=Limosilactobacillus coleohominis TaxID=181675 RepID=UPI002A90A208|nr:BppU family phage baseplate upper protein [Limosilactobacillus coleohominis]MDY5628840.1 BppU family phage baseplate upper protein [Limosilactobacillus coleohominis]
MATNNIPINGHSYVQIQTVLPVDAVTIVDELNGRQGDNMRDVYIQLLGQGDQPRALNGGGVDLVGRDSAGVIKQTNTATVINDRQGLIKLEVPAPFYQAVGEFQDAFLRIKDENGKVVSSIRVGMTVIKNQVVITQSESTLYIKTIDDLINQLKVKIDDADTLADTAQKTAQNLMDLLKTYQAEVAANAVALLGKDQTWSGRQTFNDVEVDGTLTASKLAGQAMDDILSAINAVPRVTTTKGTTGLVFGNGISKSNDGNSLIVSKTDFGNGQWIILGTGTVKLDLAAAVAGTIQLPWDIRKGNAILGGSFDYSNNMQWQLAGSGNGVIEMKAPQALKQDAYWINIVIGSIAY